MSAGLTEGASHTSPKQARGQGSPQNQIRSEPRIKSIKSTQIKSTFIKLLSLTVTWTKGDLQDVWFLNPQLMVDNLNSVYRIHVNPWIDPSLSSLPTIRCSPIRSTRRWVSCVANLSILSLQLLQSRRWHTKGRAIIGNALTTRSSDRKSTRLNSSH